jgi:hypothetical protein
VVSQAGHDRARSLLSLAVRRLPPDRRDWGQAMLAELDQLQGRAARWRFTLGCVRVALAPPRAAPSPGLAVRAAVVGGAAGVGLGIYLVSPAMRVFAVLFSVLLAGCVWIALVRSREAIPHQGNSGRILRAVLLIGVAGGVGVVLYGVVRYPGAVGDPWDPVLVLLSVVLAAMLTGYVWLALVPPRAATSHIVVVRRYGLVGGLLVGGLPVAGGVAAEFGYGKPLAGWSWLAAALAAVAGGALAGRSSGAARAGLEAGLWTGLVGALILLVVGMSATYAAAGAGRLIPSDASTIGAFQDSGLPDVTTYAVGDNLGGSIMLLVWIPLLSVAVGAVGGALGASRPRRTPAS